MRRQYEIFLVDSYWLYFMLKTDGTGGYRWNGQTLFEIAIDLKGQYMRSWVVVL